MQTRPARVERHGDPALSQKLARALDVAAEGEDAARLYTHAFHSYPARMHPLTARRALALLDLPKAARVLDPFCGSGTVLVEALRFGLAGVGVDANPLALLVAAAKTWRATPQRRRELVTAARRIAALAVEEGKAARRSGYEPPPERTPPPGMTAAERDERLKGWFDPHIRRELETLAGLVEREADEELRRLLLAILSSVIIKVSRRESDTSGKTVARKLGRGMASRLVAQRAEELVEGLGFLGKETPAGTPLTELHEGDARLLRRSGVPDGSLQAIVSSPPYAGTYDYLEHHALRLALLGLPAADFATREIGARRTFGDRPASIEAGLRRYMKDLGAALGEMTRALAPGGRAVLLIGDSLAGRGPSAQAVWADSMIADLAPAAGLEVVAAASQARTELGSSERRLFSGAGRQKQEHLVLLRRRG